jgi:hypothetical protein
VGVGVRVGVAVRLGVGVFDGVAVLVVVGVAGLTIFPISPQFDSEKIMRTAVMIRIIDKPAFLPMINLHPCVVAGEKKSAIFLASLQSVYIKKPYRTTSLLLFSYLRPHQAHQRLNTIGEDFCEICKKGLTFVKTYNILII